MPPVLYPTFLTSSSHVIMPVAVFLVFPLLFFHCDDYINILCYVSCQQVQIIKEPFLTAHMYGPERDATDDGEARKTYEEGIRKTLEIKPAKEALAFDESVATFKWVKGMMESPFPGKSFVFVHDHAFCLRGYENIPRGYTHTFLIRNPYRLFPSWKKLKVNLMPSRIDKPFSDMPQYQVGQHFGYGELYDLMVHVRDELGQTPIIIDADDLQSNPSSILRQYLDLLGVKFSESLLHWEAGDEITDTWIASKNLLRGNKMEEGRFYEGALKSTEFRPPKQLPSRDQIDGDLLPVIDRCMPIYEKMHSMRIQP